MKALMEATLNGKPYRLVTDDDGVTAVWCDAAGVDVCPPWRREDFPSEEQCIARLRDHVHTERPVNYRVIS